MDETKRCLWVPHDATLLLNTVTLACRTIKSAQEHYTSIIDLKLKGMFSKTMKNREMNEHTRGCAITIMQ